LYGNVLSVRSRFGARHGAALLMGLALAACGKDVPTGNQPGTGPVAASIVIRDGDLQSGPAGSALSEPLQVTAKDASNAPVAGAQVHFRVGRGASTGTTISDTVVVSGFDGTARVFVTLGSAVDTSTVDAFVTGSGAGPTAVTFRVVATPPPQLVSVTPTTFAAGDTVTLRGTNFNTTPAGNTVVFGSARGRIVGGSGDSVLTVVVPPCVAAGAVLARVFVGSAPTNTVSATYSAGGSLLDLARYEGITVSGADLGNCLRLLGAGAQYLLVPQSATSSDGAKRVDYVLGASVAGTTTDVVPPAPDVVPWPVGRPVAEPGTPGTLQQRLDAMLRGREHDLVLEHRGALRPSADVARSDAPPAPPALGSPRSFSVLSSLDATAFTTTQARLRFAGQHILIYVDTEGLSGAFTDAELDAFGRTFDRDLYEVDVTAFGSESDIDGNGRVIVLLSPKINALTDRGICSSQGFITGFFFGGDLLPGSKGSNKGEIFYALVPDENASKSCAHSKPQVERLIPSTFIHEFQHMISFNQHVLVRDGSEEALWLNEGLSHVAEELGSKLYESRYPAPSGRSSADQLFPDSSQGFISGDMTNAYRFLSTLPNHSAVALQGNASLEERGGAWLFLRWLGDHKGEGIYGRLVQTASTGTQNVEDKAGESFASLFGDFATAAYTDSLPGVPRSAIPLRLRFTSRSFRQIFQRFFDTNTSGVDQPFPITPMALQPGVNATGSVLQGSMDYYTLQTPASPGSVAIRFGRPDGSAFAATDIVQIGVFRLK
jgi:hypothetical protein